MTVRVALVLGGGLQARAAFVQEAIRAHAAHV